jgi:hypothetical protein
MPHGVLGRYLKPHLPVDTKAMMVSGPGGSLEASLIFQYALAQYGVNTAVAIRTGVVKVPFIPEAYVASGHSSFALPFGLFFQVEWQGSSHGPDWDYAKPPEACAFSWRL